MEIESFFNTEFKIAADVSLSVHMLGKMFRFAYRNLKSLHPLTYAQQVVPMMYI